MLSIAAMAISPFAWPHGIDVACQGQAEIRCKGTFSDGSSLAGTTVRVLSYQDVVQWTGKMDARGQVEFKRPMGKFYAQFIAADGHLSEVDHTAIRR